ncbi:MAG: hypothetical protein IJN59_03410 [Oscillospiraceae bacterium]|nr:hypothetical protein [Oscillospiraceae bacterium]
MKQIKTVIQPIWAASAFDEQINDLLSDGWTVIHREIISTKSEMNDACNYAVVQFLYAELEKNKPSFEEITL